MKQMKARLALCFGGRIAEQLIYGNDELNTGASNDIQQATDMARSMVMEYGMSEKLGWLRYRDNQEDRKSVVEGKSVSVRVDLGGRRILKKKKKQRQQLQQRKLKNKGPTHTTE